MRATALAPRRSDEAEVIELELARRKEWERMIRQFMAGLLARHRATRNRRRLDRDTHQVTMKIVRERIHRFGFDQRHPSIYRTEEERRKAHANFDPEVWPFAGLED